MTKQRTNKRPKSYYIKSAHKKGKYAEQELDAGMKGFIITCNYNEFKCRQDAYQLLNEYADEMYGPAVQGFVKEEESDDDDEEDFDLALKKEVSSIKERKQFRFQALKTSANNVLFIKADIENPCELAHYILSDLQETKKLKSRAILRLLPVSGTCKTYDDKLEQLADKIVAPHFEFSCKTYMYVIKIRINTTVKSKTIMGILDRIIRRNEDLNHRANMDNPELVILVEVIRNVCCMSVIKDFKKFRKYNLHSIVEVLEDKKEGKEESKRDGEIEENQDSAETEEKKDSGETGENKDSGEKEKHKDSGANNTSGNGKPEEIKTEKAEQDKCEGLQKAGGEQKEPTTDKKMVDVNTIKEEAVDVDDEPKLETNASN
ncbi:THUMP domain-containing protein 1-like [Antedon mediterranea]|uniref:THUMP domain-containing protein 1-like n=1 Tax=Antedon mediterranea TaxID=105859 RepID=UPI003AF83FF9